MTSAKARQTLATRLCVSPRVFPHIRRQQTCGHFQIGPADKVAADEVDGVIVVEHDALDAGTVNTVTYSFDGPGPYGYACHEPGHFQTGMTGVITFTTP